MPAPSPVDPALCFIVGSTRSGTTLMSVLLGRHSQVTATPETEFVPHLWFAGQLRERGPRGLSHEAVLADVWERCESLDDLELDRARLLARFRRGEPTHRELYRAILHEAAARHGSAVVVDGTPTNLPFVPLLLRWFPNARFIAMVRDGRDRVESLIREPWAGDHRTYYSALWAQDAARIASYMRAFPEALTVVRYEDLVGDAGRELGRVCAELGLEAEAGQLEVDGTSTAVPSRLAGSKLREVRPVDTSSVGRWREHATPAQQEQMTALMGRWLHHWGYEVPDRPPRGRLRYWWARVWTWPLRAMPYTLLLQLVRARRRLQMQVQLLRSWSRGSRRSWFRRPRFLR